MISRTTYKSIVIKPSLKFHLLNLLPRMQPLIRKKMMSHRTRGLKIKQWFSTKHLRAHLEVRKCHTVFLNLKLFHSKIEANFYRARTRNSKESSDKRGNTKKSMIKLKRRKLKSDRNAKGRRDFRWDLIIWSCQIRVKSMKTCCNSRTLSAIAWVATSVAPTADKTVHEISLWTHRLGCWICRTSSCRILRLSCALDLAKSKN